MTMATDWIQEMDRPAEYVPQASVARVVARVEELCALVPVERDEEEEAKPVVEDDAPDVLRETNPVPQDSTVRFRDVGHVYDIQVTRPDGTTGFVHNKAVIMSVSSLTKYAIADFRVKKETVAMSSSMAHRVKLEKALVAASQFKNPTEAQLTDLLGEAAAKKLAGDAGFFKLLGEPGATKFTTPKGQVRLCRAKTPH